MAVIFGDFQLLSDVQIYGKSLSLMVELSQSFLLCPVMA